MKLIIEDDEGRKTSVVIDPLLRERGEVTIGRLEGNSIRLNERNVSRKHARLVRQNGGLIVEDLKSFNGVRVNGERIEGPHEIHEGDRLEIADYYLDLQGAIADVEDQGKTEPKGVPAVAAPPAQPQQAAPRPQPRPQPAPQAPPPQAAPAPRPQPQAQGSSQATAMINLKELQGAMGAAKVESLPNRERPKLYLLSTAEAGKEYKIDKTEVKIGREDGNDIVINHRSLSRTHAKLFRDGDGHWKVQDAASANGTRVNGETYAVAPVESGDTLELGHLKFKFVAPGDDFDIQAAIREAKGAGAAAEEGAAPAPVVVQGKNNTALIIGASAGAAVLVAVIMGLMLRGGGKEAAQAAGNPAKLLQAAKDACKAEQYELCKNLADQAVAAGADPVESVKAQSEAQNGMRDAAAIEAANKAINASDWDKAKAALDGIRATSPLVARRDALMETVKGPYVTAKIEKAQKLAEACKKDAALGELAKAKGVDPANSEIAVAEEEVNAKNCQAVGPGPRAGGGGGVVPPPAPSIDCKGSLNEANQQIIKGDYEGAVKLLEKVSKGKCGAAIDAQAFRSLGVAHARLGNMDKAIKYWEQYLQLQPDSAEAPRLRKMIDDYRKSQGG